SRPDKPQAAQRRSVGEGLETASCQQGKRKDSNAQCTGTTGLASMEFTAPLLSANRGMRGFLNPLRRCRTADGAAPGAPGTETRPRRAGFRLRRPGAAVPPSPTRSRADARDRPDIAIA